MDFSRSSGLLVIGEWDFIFDDGDKITKKNLITDRGLAFIASLLAGTQSNDVSIYLGIGTGNNPVKNSDTTLQNEVLRKAVSAKQTEGSLVRLRTFFLSNEANGNWNEFGIYMAGTDVLGSGILLNRVVTPLSKASNQVLSIETRIRFNAG
jgi:hypothetical protein